MKTIVAIMVMGCLAACGHSQSVHHQKPTTSLAPAPVEKKAVKKTIRPSKEKEIDGRLEALRKELGEMNKAVAKKAEKAGENFRKKLDELWEEEGLLSKAWEKTREKSGDALESAKEHTSDGLEAGLESMEKALKSLREKIK